jgi:hypothetical protein
MEEAYVVCAQRNSESAYRRFFGPAYPGVLHIARLALRHPLTTGLIVAMNALGLLAYVWGLF